ncbi:MAG: hypothetical protein K6T31_07000, partial [Alicyclobacillus sp.]|nr:hypothetical protein [Alicyclobacillus sp.]
GNQVYLPMNAWRDHEAVNYLTSSECDEVTHTPAYKEVAVRLEVVEPSGPSPLVRGNFRLGHPHPQRGVDVERKWQRPDDRPLVDATPPASPGSQVNGG